MSLVLAAHARGYGANWITEWYACDRGVLDAAGSKAARAHRRLCSYRPAAGPVRGSAAPIARRDRQPFFRLANGPWRGQKPANAALAKVESYWYTRKGCPRATGESAVANKIPFHALVQKIQTGKITERELSQYFLAKQNPRQPFDFVVGINTDAVDVSNVKKSALDPSSLLRDAGATLDRLQASGKKKLSGKYRRKSPIIAEGDSWFKLPDLPPIVPHTLVDFLQEKYSIINLAHWGDTLAEMILAGQFWPYLTSGQSDVFLFSAAGNDVLGGEELWRFINLFDVDHAKPSDAPYYVNADFYANLQVIIGNYESVIQQIEIRAPNVIMLGHGYDYVIPRVNGPYLGDPMVRQGLYPADRPALCEAIMRVMIDAFNHKLGILQSNHPTHFKHVDLRGTINANEWWDELHPLDAGARKTAAKYAAALEKLPASGSVAPPIRMARRQLVTAA